MKKIGLLIIFSFLFFSCDKDYEENNWIIFNTCSQNVQLVIDSKPVLSPANSTNIHTAYQGEFSDIPVISFVDASLHLKGEEGWFYNNGEAIHSLTIKKQSTVPFYIAYLGGTDVYVTCNINGDYIRTSSGKEKKFELVVGTASNENGEGYDGDKVYTSQSVYEEELPYYIFYIFNSSATEADKASFASKDYIDLNEMTYLKQLYGSIRYLETAGTYTEYFLLAGSDD
ncbi:MAG: hypothetical protein K6F15_07095 [Treponema sp.]|nr:hypothetical protein [Treponema sp.]